MDKQETADSKRTPCSDVPINSANIPHATVSVSDDSGSTQSNITSNLLPEKQEPTDSNRDKALLRTSNGGITGNAELVQRVVAKRDEEERIRVAKVMLFHAFLQASRDE